ncbi:hypothetical protein [Aurantimonas sp. A3-2-R12]|uniref:hypothetical protein n=1 Tax=Aurantimonas sp. A3-2-R12 TaxID=3114362 RepID=UPI002E1979C6|nr:hypothetical protein [Aurantimonas sp. A3-2-R12]
MATADGASEPSCPQQKYFSTDETDRDRYQITVTEINISEEEPRERCPKGGDNYRFSYQYIDVDSPVYIWFRLQGSNELVTKWQNNGIKEAKIFVSIYKSDIMGVSEIETFPLKSGIDLDKLQVEFRKESEEINEPKYFDWRTYAKKENGMSDPGRYYIKIQIEALTRDDVLCHSTVPCTIEGGGTPGYVVFVK